MVGTTDVGFPIRLEGLVYVHSSFASYEPEIFPGLIYRLASPRVVFLIFVSGKIVITGAKTERDLTDAFTKLYPVLLEFRKASVAPMPGSSLAPALNPALTTAASGGSTGQSSQGMAAASSSTALVQAKANNTASGTAAGQTASSDQREIEHV